MYCVITRDDDSVCIFLQRRVGGGTGQHFCDMLLGQAIPGEDVKTVRYSLQPEFSYEKNKRRLTGYVARADYKVKIKNLEKLSAVIDKSVGCNVTVDRVEFGLNNRSLFENRLLEEAVANARSKAAVVARAGGRSHHRQRDPRREPEHGDGKSGQHGYGGIHTYRTGSGRHHRRRQR